MSTETNTASVCEPTFYTGGAFIRYVELPPGAKMEHVAGDTWRVIAAPAPSASLSYEPKLVQGVLDDLERKGLNAATCKFCRNVENVGQLPPPQYQAGWDDAMAEKASASSAALTEDQIAVRAGIPFVGLSVTLMKALRRLSFAAQTSGGVAGRDDELMGAIKQAQEALEAAKGKGLEEVAVDPDPASSEAATR